MKPDLSFIAADQGGIVTQQKRDLFERSHATGDNLTTLLLPEFAPTLTELFEE